MSKVVLDTSAVVAAIRNEPGAATVIGLPDDALVSTVNLAEVVTRMAEEGLSEPTIHDSLALLTFDTVPFDEVLAWRTGLLRPITRHLGLSLGDRACLALAMTLDVPVLTADRLWASLDLGIDVRLIR